MLALEENRSLYPVADLVKLPALHPSPGAADPQPDEVPGMRRLHFVRPTRPIAYLEEMKPERVLVVADRVPLGDREARIAMQLDPGVEAHDAPAGLRSGGAGERSDEDREPGDVMRTEIHLPRLTAGPPGAGPEVPCARRDRPGKNRAP